MNIESKLKQLRIKWSKYPKKRKTIELQAKILKSAKTDYSTSEDKDQANLAVEVIDKLF